MIKAYKVIWEDRDDVYKDYIPAESEEQAAEFVRGNGDVIKVTEVTDDFPLSTGSVGDALLARGFGRAETDLITRMIGSFYKNSIN